MFSMGINSEILLLMFKTDIHVNFKKVAMRDHWCRLTVSHGSEELYPYACHSHMGKSESIVKYFENHQVLMEQLHAGT